MATTNFGVNHPLARKLWAEKLIREALKETWIGRFIGNDSRSLIQIQTDTQKEAGDRIRMGLRVQLTGAGVSGDNTLEGLEEAMTFYHDDIFIDQLRNAVRSEGKASEQRVPYDMREEARIGLTDWLSGRMDTAFFNQITGYTTESDTRYTGMQATIAPTSSSVAASHRVVIAGGQEGEASLSATVSHALTLRDIDKAVALAKTASPVIRPLRYAGDDYYVLFIHPFALYQLRGQTSTGEWADIQKAAMQGGQIKDNPVFTGAAGIYNNTIIHEATRLPNTVSLADNSGFRRAAFCGAQAAGLAFGQGHAENRVDWQEELFDYGNQLGVAISLIWGLKKTVFNNVDFGTITLSGYAPAP